MATAVQEPFSDYESLYRWSIDQPEAFWFALWEFAEIVHSKKPDRILQPAMPGSIWFEGSRLNFAENLLRRRGSSTALLSLSEHRPTLRLSYDQLRTQVAQCATSLRIAGIEPGDRVVGYVPNFWYSVVAMLASTSIGAVWSSCSPDFGYQGVLDRFGQIEPRILFTADGYQYGGKRFDLLSRVRDISKSLSSIERIVVAPWLDESPNLEGLEKACLWDSFLTDLGQQEVDEISFDPLPFDHPVYILYSSGTTGIPKCIVHGAGGTLLQHAKELLLHCDLTPQDNIFYYTTCGWMMWNWLVSSLMTGCKVTLYDGSPAYPGISRMWDTIDEHQISIFGTSPKFLGLCRKEGLSPRSTHTMKSLKAILSTGSPLLPEDFDWVYQEVKTEIQLSSISGGTDIVSCFVLGNPNLPVYRGEIQCRGLGMAVEAFDSHGNSIRNEKGELVCTRPFPSMPIHFWNDPEGKRYHNAYFNSFPDIWTHGDFIEITENNGIRIFGRSDSTLNPGGVRIGTAEIYRQVETLDEILDSLAIGQKWDDDTRVILFVVLAPEATLNDDLRNVICDRIRKGTTPRHVPSKILEVPGVPYTISGKKVELAVTQIVHGVEPGNKDALANPESLDGYRNRAELKVH